MKTIVKNESYNPMEIETHLQRANVEELEARLEMSVSWCTSECGTSKPEAN